MQPKAVKFTTLQKIIHSHKAWGEYLTIDTIKQSTGFYERVNHHTTDFMKKRKRMKAFGALPILSDRSQTKVQRAEDSENRSKMKLLRLSKYHERETTTDP